MAHTYGTDKASYGHDYMEVYAQYFTPLRKKPLTFLEIGIASGSSAAIWEAYFENAELHFIDIDPGAGRSHSSRVNYHFLDQSDRVALAQFANLVDTITGKFDIIIDDGGHTMDQQITSFEVLFPFLKPGGLYIIEDLHTSYWTGHGGNGNCESPLAGEGTTVEFLKELVEDLNYTGGATGYGTMKKVPPTLFDTLTEYQKNIYSIHFYKSLCVVKKRGD
ncbi:MAG: class I SAM-dependent methyltransferase [Verrucomicrobia bacterium]|nr:class I SAM-dependent methyltransferase [Verrucomicrobiota bacterium]